MSEPHPEMTSSIPASAPRLDPLEVAAHAATDALYAFELASGAFHWREGASRRFGHAASMGGLDWWKATVHPEDLERVLDGWQSAIRLGAAEWAVEYRLKRADGTYAHVADHGRVWLDASGRPVGVAGGLRDVTEHHWTMQALAESEERYRQLVEMSPDSVVVHSEGRIVYANRQALRLYGAEKASDLIGTWVLESIHPDCREVVKARMGRLVNGEAVPLIEETFLRMDGTPFEVEVAASPTIFQGKPAIQAIVRDIGDRKRAEAALRASEQRYRLLVETAFEGVWVVDAQHRTTYVNQRLAELLGLPAEAMLGRHPAEFCVPEDGPAIRENLARRVQGVREQYELRLQRADGSTMWVLISGCPLTSEEGAFLGSLGMVTDLSAYKEAQAQIEAQKAELAQAYEQLRAHADAVEAEVAVRTRELASQKALTERIIANAPAGLGFMDRQLVFRWLNPMLSKFLGFPAEALVGRPLFEVIPEVEPQFGPILQGVLDTGEPFRATAAPFVYVVDGVERTTYWDYAYMAVFDEDGEAVGVLVLNHEVSDRVEQEQRLQEQIEKLREVDRLKASFINTVTHELRTPLTSIRGYAEFLEDGIGGELSEDQSAFVAQIQAGADKLRRLVDDLLDFARLEAGTFQLVVQEGDLGALVRQEAASLLPQMKEKRLTLSLDLPDEPVKVRMDAPRIGQVLLNVAGNAVKFTRAGGEVAIAMRVEGAQVRVAVTDTGIGIAPDHLPLLFQKFYQVDPSATREYGGAGLGLAICKSLVEAHGGHMGVESVQGEGSTFWFTLPL